MKRWIFLLALPYVVEVGTSCIKFKEIYRKITDDKAINVECLEWDTNNFYSVGTFRFPDKDQAEDLAYALNEAHDRRTNHSPENVTNSIKPNLVVPGVLMEGPQ